MKINKFYRKEMTIMRKCVKASGIEKVGDVAVTIIFATVLVLCIFFAG